MQTVVHPESGLRKATLWDDELAKMTWDYCRIHALALTDDEGPPEDQVLDAFREDNDLDPTAPPGLQLHLDIDYIVRRIDSESMYSPVRFWVAPATLTFLGVSDIVGGLHSVCLPMELKNLRQEEEPGSYLHEPRWHLEACDMDLRLRASCYVLYVRRPPRYGGRVLRMAERGGISFDRHPYT